MLNFKKPLFFLSIFSLFLLSGCGKDTKIPDVSDINISLNINPFEDALFSLDTLQLKEGVQQLKTVHPIFSDLFFQRIVPLDNGKKDNNFPTNVGEFIKYPSIKTLYDTTKIVFSDFAPIEKELKRSFQYYKHYFPNRDTPDIYTFISEYTYQTFIFDNNGKDAIGIGLDMFLGETYPYRKYLPDNPSFSDYLTRAFNKAHLPKKVMDVIVDDLVGLPKGQQLLDEMINNGKKMYVLDKLMPMTPDTIKWEYTPAQLEWCRANEGQLWTHLIHDDLLYSADHKKIRKLVDPSPKGPSNMPPEAPGRTANWIGYKIIKAYMLRNPNISLQALIDNRETRELLEQARYRPKVN